MKPQDIISAWARIRANDNTIPDDVLDFMKDASLEKLKAVNLHAEMLEALKEIRLLHTEQVFLCGEDDEAMVQKTLSKIDAVLSRAEAK